MAITFVKTPEPAHPAKNVAPVLINTDNQYIIAPGPALYANLVIRVVADPPTTGNFKLFIGDPIIPLQRELTFTFHASPNDNGFQLPTNALSEPINDYVNDTLIPALLKNYYIAQGYSLKMQNGSTTQAEIVFTARNYGIENSIVFTENFTANEIIGVSVSYGSSPQVRDNFRIFMDVFREKTFYTAEDEIIFSSEATPDIAGNAEFDIHRILTAASSYTVPPFTGDIIEPINGPIRYYLAALESYDEPPTPRAYKRHPAVGYYYALHGGQRYVNAPYTGLYSNHINASATEWLTAMPNNTIVHPAQKQFLSLFLRGTTVGGVPQTGTYRLQGIMYYTDGSNSGSYATWTTFNNIVGENFYSFRVGYTDLAIKNRKASGKTVASYSIRIINAANNAVSQVFTFNVEQDDTRNPRYFLFINSYGMPESIYCFGERVRKVELNTKNIQRHTVSVDAVKKIVHGEFDQVDSEYQNVYEISTGNKNRDYMQYFIDFINSPVRFQQYATHYQKIILKSTDISLDTDNESTFAVRFSLSDAQMERGIA